VLVIPRFIERFFECDLARVDVQVWLLRRFEKCLFTSGNPTPIAIETFFQDGKYVVDRGATHLLRELPHQLNLKRNADVKATGANHRGCAMLAEIFMIRLEAVARAAKEAANSPRFVPVTLPAAKAS